MPIYVLYMITYFYAHIRHTHVYLLLRPYTFSYFYTSAPKYLYMFTFFYAHNRPINVSLHLRSYTYTSLQLRPYMIIYTWLHTSDYIRTYAYICLLPRPYIFTSLHNSISCYVYMLTYFYVYIRLIHIPTPIHVYQFTYFYAYMRVRMCMKIISNSLKLRYITLRKMIVDIPLILKSFNLKKSCTMYLSILKIRNAQIIYVPNLQIYIYYIFKYWVYWIRIILKFSSKIKIVYNNCSK